MGDNIRMDLKEMGRECVVQDRNQWQAVLLHGVN